MVGYEQSHAVLPSCQHCSAGFLVAGTFCVDQSSLRHQLRPASGLASGHAGSRGVPALTSFETELGQGEPRLPYHSGGASQREWHVHTRPEAGTGTWLGNCSLTSKVRAPELTPGWATPRARHHSKALFLHLYGDSSHLEGSLKAHTKWPLTHLRRGEPTCLIQGYPAGCLLGEPSPRQRACRNPGRPSPSVQGLPHSGAASSI